MKLTLNALPNCSINKILTGLSFGLVFNLHLSNAQLLAPTEDHAHLTIKVTDYNEIPEVEATVTVTGVDTSLVFNGITNVDGKYELLVPEGKKYKVSIHKFGEDFDFEKPLTIEKKFGSIKFEQKLKIRIVTEYVRIFTLDHVYFDVNKYDLKKDSYPSLNLLLVTLKKNPGMKVEIAGHTDDAGDDKLNMVLSQKRADEVMSYLVKEGISNNRILAKGYGESVPVAPNTDDVGRQKNRRTEVRVISE